MLYKRIVHFEVQGLPIDNCLLNKRQIIPKGQSKMNTPEKMRTQGTQDEEKQNKNTTL